MQKKITKNTKNLSLKEILSSELTNRSGSHIIADCPFCDKKGHFYINVIKTFQKDDSGIYKRSWDCKHCGEVGNLNKLLKKLDKEHLLEEPTIDIGKLLEKKIKDNSSKKNIEELDLILSNKRLPTGFKRIYEDDYLQGRGFTFREFRKYNIGVTNVLFKFKDYIIFSIEEAGECKGYIARSKLSKERIKDINKLQEQKGEKKKYLRYINSENTDFSKMLFGFDDIDFFTKTVILVEGMFDKIRVDQALDLYLNRGTRCCSTFGKSISDFQLLKLKNKGIENIILVQDPDAIAESKSISFRVKSLFKSVLVGYVDNDKDLGDSTKEEIVKFFEKLKTPMNYFVSMVSKKKLL